MGFAPTHEQNVALQLFATGKSLVIEAGAGAGKTSTLVLLAKSTSRRGQYVAFNRAIVEESKAKMPRNVACNTAHSLAARAMRGKINMDRLNGGRMKSTELARRLDLREIVVTIEDEKKRLSASFLAGVVMKSVARFCQSADTELSAKHMPYLKGIDSPPGSRINNDRVAKSLVPHMRLAWADLMKDDGALPFTHDHYLKAWQLSGPQINAEFILFDEAQDANPVMVAIVAAQTHAQLVWVGDSQQQIYTFTGAVNALQAVPAEQKAFLTQSFRFGSAVANVANHMLARLDAELRIVGTPTIASRVSAHPEPNCILTRTNANAVQNVLTLQTEGKRVHLVGGGREIVSFAKAARSLMDTGWTEHPELACFESWNEVREYVEQDEQGGDLRLMVKLVDEFTVETILAALDNMVPESRADVIVSTAHKSKGREWNIVRLGSDFPDDNPQEEELRLLYVAVTRAKLTLDISGVTYLVGGETPYVDHDDPTHDFADCPDCIRQAREAEHAAESSVA